MDDSPAGGVANAIAVRSGKRRCGISRSVPGFFIIGKESRKGDLVRKEKL
jgi:hypothetical protein